MKKRLQFYLNYYETLTTKKSLTTAEAAREQKQLLIQIQFFQHERLVHLIVTMTFAVLTMLSFGIVLLTQLIQLTVLTAALLVLLIPYIFHYYLLENEVQKMYAQYDEIWENCNIILQEKCLGKSSKK